MIYRSKAPLRIGLAGGGTDVSPYCDKFGGAILNITISLYAHASIELIPGNESEIIIADSQHELRFTHGEKIEATGKAALPVAVYNRILKDYGLKNSAFRLTTSVDAPAGSGLGTSSTLVVAVLGAFAEMLQLPLGEYDIAHYAWEIERKDLAMAGGRQDQYAATFGGVNYMEFYENDKVVVNPLHVRSQYLYELENNLLLYFTGSSRDSAEIIERQARNAKENNQAAIEAMHQLKNQAVLMKEALLKGNLNEMGAILDFGFSQKKLMAEGISNPYLEEIYEAAKKAGATGGKMSGAGGGGFMIFYCPANTGHLVTKVLEKFGGAKYPYQFVLQGMQSWSV